MNSIKTLYKLMEVSSRDLEIPDAYQRKLNTERVAKIVAGFNERIANEPKVSFRDGHYYVFDGQHTIVARKHMNGNNDLPILCKVYYGTRTQSQRRFIRRIPRSSSRSWTFSPIILITVLSGRWQAQTIRVAITQVSGFTFIWITATTVWISPAAARARSSSTALSGTSATGVTAQSLP